MVNMADIDANMAELALEDRMVRAIREFETAQLSSNMQWLAAQVASCEAVDTDDATLNRCKDGLAKRLCHESWESLASRYKVESSRESLSKDVGQFHKGTYPPLPPGERRDFLQKLHKAINKAYDQDVSEYQPVPLPDDYGLLLSVTDGVHDTDLRDSGVCGVNGILKFDFPTMTAEDVEQLPWGGDLWRRGWELSTGFCLGRGKNVNQHWLAYYYCSRSEETSHGPWQYRGSIEDEEREWKWRLFYKEPERFQLSFLWPMVFDNLTLWLQFYRKWWERECKIYPEWSARMARDVELLYGHESEQDEEVTEDSST